MRKCLFIIVAAFGLSSVKAITVDTLPEPIYADTEVVTNIAIAAELVNLSRIEVMLSLTASPTNCVVVGIGTDADNDGVLSDSETAYVFGCDCGYWFERNAAKNEEIKDQLAVSGRVERKFILRRRYINQGWDLIKVTRRGIDDVGECAIVEGRVPGMLIRMQ